jgi:hypothetical protein
MSRLRNAALLLLCSLSAFAQSEPGTIQGSILALNAGNTARADTVLEVGATNLGDHTRFNPNFRQFANLSKDVSLSLQSATCGQLQSSGHLLNTPRRLPLALKLYY